MTTPSILLTPHACDEADVAVHALNVPEFELWCQSAYGRPPVELPIDREANAPSTLEAVTARSLQIIAFQGARRSDVGKKQLDQLRREAANAGPS